MEGSSKDRERVFVSWNEEWDLERYIDYYLETRKFDATAEARKSLRALIDKCPASGMLKKSDLDFWLDAKVREIRK